MSMTKARLSAFALLLAGLASAAPAQEVGTVASGRDGGLMAVAALMPGTGRDFNLLWETPRETTPDLPMLDTAVVGQPVTFALLAAGMSVNAGQAALECRVSLIYPDGTAQMAVDGPCTLTRIPGPVSDLYPAVLFDFGLPASLAGQTIGVDARLTDRGNGASVSLRLALPIRAGEG